MQPKEYSLGVHRHTIVIV